MKVSLRIAAIARMVPKGKVVADIGTDHAILPVYLVSEGISPAAIASDLKSGPLDAARKTVNQAGLDGKIKIRLGFGLSTVKPGEAEVAVIAGMGGGTIAAILEACGSQCPIEYLVAQPMNDSGQLRRWLIAHDWQIDDEDIVEEDGRLYEIIFAIKRSEESNDKTAFTVSDVILSVGPRLIEKNHPLLKKLIAQEINQNEKILLSLNNATGEEAKSKRSILIDRNRGLECIAHAIEKSNDNSNN